MGPTRSARDHLAVALDVPDLAQARALIDRLAGVPGWLKVGGPLFVAAGPAALTACARTARVFLDLKLHDIPAMVARTVAAATRQGVGLLTLHASGGAAMLRAAREAAEDEAVASGLERPRLVAVTVLTSLGPADLKEVGVVPGDVEEQVARLVDLARAAGLDGVVASAREAALVRQRAGEDLWIVTPGIRPEGSAKGDEVRTASPGAAVGAGSDLVVVGRPIAGAPDPATAARLVVREIEQTLARREG